MNKNHPVVGEQIPRDQKPLVDELEPDRMPVAVILVQEHVVVDEVVAASIIRRIDFDALDPPRMGHTQGTQGVVIFPLDQQILIRAFADRQALVEIPRHEIPVHRPVCLDQIRIAFPDQAEAGFIALAEEGDELVLRQVGIFPARGGWVAHGFLILATDPK